MRNPARPCANQMRPNPAPDQACALPRDGASSTGTPHTASTGSSGSRTNNAHVKNPTTSPSPTAPHEIPKESSTGRMPRRNNGVSPWKNSPTAAPMTEPTTPSEIA